jgi:hypothetical protein
MRLSFTVLAGIASVGCTEPSAQTRDPRTQRLEALSQIAEQCQLPASTFRLIEDQELRVVPSPDTPYERVDCALQRIRSNPLLRNIPMGFVGNERAS